VESAGRDRRRGSRGSRSAAPHGTAANRPPAAGFDAESSAPAPGFTARFDALRRWRLERARFEGKPAFTIATDRALEDIATSDPATIDALLDCHGIGAHKAKKYGRDILDVLRQVRDAAA
jgi:ATP-dependent DNA helicase RecQ